MSKLSEIEDIMVDVELELQEVCVQYPNCIDCPLKETTICANLEEIRKILEE